MTPSQSQKELLTFRYSLIAETQLQMYADPLPEPKGKVILTALTHNGEDREYKYFGKLYYFIGFREVIPSANAFFPPDRFWIGKLAKLRKTETGVKIPGDIIGHPQDDWVGLVTVFDTLTQHIFIEKNWKFGKPEQVERALQVGLQKPVLDKYNHKIFVKGKGDVRKFWNLVRESTEIYKLELKLISPNILETNQNAREALSDLKNIFQQDEIDITLKNDSGDLEIPIPPISNYIDYIGEGEGSWKITQKGYEGRKKTFSSYENIDIVEVSPENFPTADVAIDIPPEERSALNRKKENRLVNAIYSLITGQHD